MTYASNRRKNSIRNLMIRMNKRRVASPAMDEILNGMRRMTSQCGEDEYDNLLDMIQLIRVPEAANGGFETARRVNDLNRRYMDNITFNLDDYGGDRVTEANCRFIVTVKQMLDAYMRMIGNDPYNYDEQIAHSLKIYEKMRDGLDVGMIMAKNASRN